MGQRIRSTTVLCVRRDGKVVMAGDGQVTLGHEVLKSTARKLRRLYNDRMPPVLRVPQRTLFRCLRASKPSSNSSTEAAAVGGRTGEGLAYR